MLITESNKQEAVNLIRRDERAEGRAEKEKENVLSAISEGISKEKIMEIFHITEEKYCAYLSML